MGSYNGKGRNQGNDPRRGTKGRRNGFLEVESLEGRVLLDAAPSFESAPAPEQRAHRWTARLGHKHRDGDNASTETTS